MKLKWNIVHDCDMEDGTPTQWSLKLADGTFLWIDLTADGKFDVIDSDGKSVLKGDLKTLGAAKRWVTVNYPMLIQNITDTRILECVMTVDEQKRYFCFSGKVIPDGDTLEFEDLRITEQTADGTSVFEPHGTTWAGAKIDEEYAICDVLARFTRKEQGFEMPYQNDVTRKFTDKFCDTVNAGAYELPKKIVYGSLLSEYTLFLVTDKYTYYNSEDQFLMLVTDSREVASDNYFAEVGYADSVAAIRGGSEKMLWYWDSNAQYPEE